MLSDKDLEMLSSALADKVGEPLEELRGAIAGIEQRLAAIETEEAPEDDPESDPVECPAKDLSSADPERDEFAKWKAEKAQATEQARIDALVEKALSSRLGKKTPQEPAKRNEGGSEPTIELTSADKWKLQFKKETGLDFNEITKPFSQRTERGDDEPAILNRFIGEHGNCPE